MAVRLSLFALAALVLVCVLASISASVPPAPLR